jgi:hypothetical protein
MHYGINNDLFVIPKQRINCIFSDNICKGNKADIQTNCFGKYS